MIEQIGDYKLFFENEVYAKDGEVDAIKLNKDGAESKETMPIKYMLIPEVYTLPSREDVMRYIKDKIEKLEGAAKIIGSTAGERTLLEKIIIVMYQLTPQITNRLKRGEGDETLAVESMINIPQLKERQPFNRYIRLRYGIIPTKTIDENQKLGKIDSAKWYNSAFSHEGLFLSGFGERYSIEILLDENKCLIDKVKIDNAIDIETRDATGFRLTYPYFIPLDFFYVIMPDLTEKFAVVSIPYPRRLEYDQKEIRNIVDAVYNAFTTSRGIKELEDISEEKKEEFAFNGIYPLARKILNQVIGAARAQQSQRQTASQQRNHIIIS